MQSLENILIQNTLKNKSITNDISEKKGIIESKVFESQYNNIELSEKRILIISNGFGLNNSIILSNLEKNIDFVPFAKNEDLDSVKRNTIKKIKSKSYDLVVAASRGCKVVYNMLEEKYFNKSVDILLVSPVFLSELKTFNNNISILHGKYDQTSTIGKVRYISSKNGVLLIESDQGHGVNYTKERWICIFQYVLKHIRNPKTGRILKKNGTTGKNLLKKNGTTGKNIFNKKQFPDFRKNAIVKAEKNISEIERNIKKKVQFDEDAITYKTDKRNGIMYKTMMEAKFLLYFKSVKEQSKVTCSDGSRNFIRYNYKNYRYYCSRVPGTYGEAVEHIEYIKSTFVNHDDRFLEHTKKVLDEYLAFFENNETPTPAKHDKLQLFNYLESVKNQVKVECSNSSKTFVNYDAELRRLFCSDVPESYEEAIQHIKDIKNQLDMYLAYMSNNTTPPDQYIIKQLPPPPPPPF